MFEAYLALKAESPIMCFGVAHVVVVVNDSCESTVVTCWESRGTKEGSPGEEEKELSRTNSSSKRKTTHLLPGRYVLRRPLHRLVSWSKKERVTPSRTRDFCDSDW